MRTLTDRLQTLVQTEPAAGWSIAVADGPQGTESYYNPDQTFVADGGFAGLAVAYAAVAGRATDAQLPKPEQLVIENTLAGDPQMLETLVGVLRGRRRINKILKNDPGTTGTLIDLPHGEQLQCLTTARRAAHMAKVVARFLPGNVSIASQSPYGRALSMRSGGRTIVALCDTNPTNPDFAWRRVCAAVGEAGTPTEAGYALL